MYIFKSDKEFVFYIMFVFCINVEIECSWVGIKVICVKNDEWV